MNATASLQTRIDSKYIVPWDVFRDWQQSLPTTHRVLDIEGRRVFTYKTHYFDTPSLDLYQDHIQGRRKRFKVRTRQYVETGLSFLEIKLKGGRGQTIKKRIPHDPMQLTTMDKDATSFVRATVRDIYGQDFTERLVPTISTHYRRFTLMATAFSERITCDFDLQFWRDGTSHAALDGDHVLIEVKTARGRGTSERELWRRGQRPLGGSKYCIGVSLAWEDLKNNALRRQIRRFYR